MTELLDHQLQMLDTRSARVEFFGLFGQRLALRIEFGFKPPDLLILRSDQQCMLLLVRTNQIEQSIAIECIQIR